MKKKDVFEMAIKSGLCDKDLSINDKIYTDYGDATESVELFAKIVAYKAIAEEREQCAKLCDQLADYCIHEIHEINELRNDEIAKQCAYEIRMRNLINICGE